LDSKKTLGYTVSCYQGSPTLLSMSKNVKLVNSVATCFNAIMGQ